LISALPGTGWADSCTVNGSRLEVLTWMRRMFGGSFLALGANPPLHEGEGWRFAWYWTLAGDTAATPSRSAKPDCVPGAGREFTCDPDTGVTASSGLHGVIAGIVAVLFAEWRVA